MTRTAAARAEQETAAAPALPEAARDPAEPVAYGPLAEWVGFHLRMAQTASFSAFAREADGIAVGPGRFALLTLIGHNPGISQTALSRANGRDKSTLTPALDDLVRRGLVRRERVARDRRSYALRLTPEGEAALQELTARAARHEANLDRIIGPKERARFVKILKRIAGELGDAAGG
ncbi:MAG TPA: MarR family transcriptional regulator [Beijerinckiaceae bacterium]